MARRPAPPVERGHGRSFSIGFAIFVGLGSMILGVLVGLLAP